MDTFKQPADNKADLSIDLPSFTKRMNKYLEILEKYDTNRAGDIQPVLSFAFELLAVRIVQFRRFNDEQMTLCLHDLHQDLRHVQRVPAVKETFSYDAFVKHGKSIAVCEDLQKSDGLISDTVIQNSGLRSFLGCPVKMDGNIIGSLLVFDSKPRAFDGLHILLLKIMALLISIVEAQKKIQSSLEERLYESETLNYQTLQMSPAAIYTIDLINQRFVAVNEHMCRSTGYSEAELLAMNPSDLLTADSRTIFFQRCEAMAAGKIVTPDVELGIQTKGGDVEWGQFHIRHLYKDGKITGANVVAHFITDKKKSQEELAKYRKQLESLVKARTAELARSNAQLRDEIERRAEATEKLRASSDSLKEMNTAMRVLLDKRIEDQQHTEEIIRTNLKELIDPYLERLENSGLRSSQRRLLDVIRMNLDEVVGSSTPELSSKYYMLSPNEVQVVNLIRKGKTSKEMSRLLNLSVRTIEAYRNSIRKKFNLKNKRINLRTYLSSI